MRRVVGRGRKKTPAKTLDETSRDFDERINNIDGKEADLNKQIRQLKLEINKVPKGSPARRQKEQRAKMLLRQRRMYQKQGDMARNQQANIDLQKFNMDSMAATVSMVQTMKATKKEMSRQMKKIDIEKVMSLKEDLDEMMMDNEEIQDLLGENPMMDDLDEDELDAELDALDDFDEELIDDTEAPGYLRDDPAAYELPTVPSGGLDYISLPPRPRPEAEPKAEGL